MDHRELAMDLLYLVDWNMAVARPGMEKIETVQNFGAVGVVGVVVLNWKVVDWSPSRCLRVQLEACLEILYRHGQWRPGVCIVRTTSLI